MKSIFTSLLLSIAISNRTYTKNLYMALIIFNTLQQICAFLETSTMQIRSVQVSYLMLLIKCSNFNFQLLLKKEFAYIILAQLIILIIYIAKKCKQNIKYQHIFCICISICPINLFLISKLLLLADSIALNFVLIFSYIIYLILWFTLVYYWPILYTQSATISSLKQIIAIILYNIVLFVNILQGDIKLIVCLLILVIRFYIEIRYFDYINLDLSYLHLKLKLGSIGFSITYLVLIRLNLSLEYIYFLLGLMIAVQKTNLLKKILMRRYKYILKNFMKLHDKQQILMLILLLKNKIQSNQLLNSVSSLKYTILNLVSKEQHKNLCHFQQSQNGLIQNFILKKYYQLFPEQICLCLAYLYFQDGEYVKSVYYTSRQKTYSNLNISINYQFLRAQMHVKIQQDKKLNLKIEAINSKRICLINNEQQTLQIKEIVQEVMELQRLFKLLEDLSKQYLCLILKVVEYQEEKQIYYHLQKQYKIKKLIDKFFESGCKKFKNKQILAIYYIYKFIYCQTKHSFFQQLDSIFKQFNHDYVLNISKKQMICIVSAQEFYQGRIIQANNNMKQFFNINTDQIKRMNQNIQRIIPRTIRKNHKDLMRAYLKRGHSDFIGQKYKMYAQKQDIIFPIYIYISILPDINGITFGSRILVSEDPVRQNLIFFDQQGIICGYNQNFQVLVKNESLDYQSFKLSFSETLKMKNLKKNKNSFKQKFIEVQMNNGSKLNLLIKSLIGKNYFFGICKVMIKQIKDSQIKTNINNNISETKKNSKFLRKIKDQNLTLVQNKLKENSKIDGDFKYLVISLICTFISIIIILYISSSYTKSNSALLLNLLNFQRNDISSILRNFQLNKILNIDHAINLGIFPNALNTNTLSITNLQQYLTNIQESYISKFDKCDSLILQNSILLPHVYIQKNFFNRVKYLGDTNEIELDLITTISLFKSYLHEIINLSISQFQNEWTKINNVIIYITNSVDYQFNILNNILRTDEMIIKNDFCDYKVRFMISIIIIIINIIIVFRMIYQSYENKKKYLQMIINLPKRDMQQKGQTIKNGLQLLSEIRTYYITSIDLDIFDHSLKYYCNQKQIELNTRSQHNYDTNYRYNKKTIQSNYILISKFINVIIVTLTMISILCFLTSNTNIASSNEDSLNFYFQFISKARNISNNLAGLSDLVINSIMQSNQTQFLNQSLNNYFHQIEYSIYHRDFEDFLKVSNVSWKYINQYLYTDLCAISDQICSYVLSNALTKGLSSAIIKYSTQLINLYYRTTLQLTQEDLTKTYELIIGYQKYLRDSIINSEQLGSIVVKQKLNNNIDLLNNSTIIIICIIIILGILIIVGSKMILKQTIIIKSQAFSILSVDTLKKDINYAGEILTLI